MNTIITPSFSSVIVNSNWTAWGSNKEFGVAKFIGATGRNYYLGVTTNSSQWVGDY